MQSIFEHLVAAGEPGLDTLCADAAEESLHLEFKTLSDHSGTRLTKDDRRLIAKALCGLSNAEGGTLILGIKTERHDNIDVARELKPFENCKSLRSRIVAALPDLLSPQNTHINVESITQAGKISGYILIDVSSSDRRPHMSIPEHRYFRRGSDGTRVMEHGEIRDLMFAPKSGEMELRVAARPGGSQGSFNFQVYLEIQLANVGRVPISAPYVQCPDASFHLTGLPGVIQPRTGAGGFGLYTGRDFLLHTDDVLSFGQFTMGLFIDHVAGNNDKTTLQKAIRFGHFESIFVYCPWAMQIQGDRPQRRMPDFRFRYGAENVAAQESVYDPGYSIIVETLAKAIWPDII